MCGICGQIDFGDKAASIEKIEAMTKALFNRGPDDLGLHVHGNTALGHRRLKIIDLSQRARQPMADNQLGLTIVYNGALYNYDALRSQLTSKGYSFFSSGDTEVILKAYHAWGPECVKHFNGMFAFAIAHRDSGDVFLARDRLGIKPLYYARTNKSLQFASSLPALLTGGDIDTGIDPVALHHYMTFHSVVPAPRTILKGIKKLPPGSTMMVEADGTMTEDTYWDLSFVPGPAQSAYQFEDWKQLLLIHLRKAVKRRLKADVPVGVLLSGGLDSSLIVGLLAEQGQNNLNTFSIGFEDVNGEAGNEFEYSDHIARHFSTEHHKIQGDATIVLPEMENCVLAMSEPMVSHDCIGFYLLSKAVSKHLKVVQSGQGADEVFGGYHWYPPMLNATDAVNDYAHLFFDSDHADHAKAVHPRFVEEDYSLGFVMNHFSSPDADAAVDKALRIDTTVMLVDDPVKRVDNMTMAWGLEARVPFLDHELVEFAARIPAEFKIANGGKHILKEAAREIIPPKVIDRPKGYFPVPALKYLRGDYLEFVREIMLSPRSVERELFNPAFVHQVLEAPDKHITPLNGSRLWQMATLQYWLTMHRI
ncbi:MAG: N-acetylglutaminylglutamine amidotransferase [Desulfobacteraceae bacterium]